MGWVRLGLLVASLASLAAAESRKVRIVRSAGPAGEADELQVETPGEKLTFKPMERTAAERRSCVFRGRDPSDPSRWIVHADCPHFKQSLLGEGTKTFSVNAESHTAEEIEDTMPEVTDEEPEAHENPFVRVFNKDSGEAELKLRSEASEEELEAAGAAEAESESVMKRAAGLAGALGRAARRKRSTEGDWAHLQLAVFVDEALYKEFLAKYGPAAEEAVREYADFVVDTAEILWELDSMAPKLKIHLAKEVEIWKVQPTGMPNDKEGDVSTYLDAAAAFIEPGAKSGMDHASVWTGLGLKFHSKDASGAPRLLAVNGVSRRGGICTANALSVLNADVSWIGGGYTFAHELGHNLGMCHDGDASCPLAKDCSQDVRIMTRSGTANGANILQWSQCSVAQFQAMLTALDGVSRNCLRDEVVPEPLHLGSYPGQRKPPEASCHDLGGACARHVPDQQAGNCRAVYCTLDNDFGRPARYSGRYLPEGAYCGPSQLCMSGECVKVDGSLGQLTPTDGGWSRAWTEGGGSRCHAHSCDNVCEMAGQLLLRFEYRRCSNPYPLNGGKACAGLNVRARACGAEACAAGAQPDDWRRELCETKLGARKRTLADRANAVRSDLVCQVGCVSTQSLMYKYDDLNGSPCEKEGRAGRCVDGVCFLQCPSDAGVFAHDAADCHESEEHHELSHKAAGVSQPTVDLERLGEEEEETAAQELAPEAESTELPAATPTPLTVTVTETATKPEEEEADCEMKYLPSRRATNPGPRLDDKKHRASKAAAAFLCARKTGCEFGMFRGRGSRGKLEMFSEALAPEEYDLRYQANSAVTMTLCGCHWLKMERARYGSSEGSLKRLKKVASAEDAVAQCKALHGCNMVSLMSRKKGGFKAELLAAPREASQRTFRRGSKRFVLYEELCSGEE